MSPSELGNLEFKVKWDRSHTRVHFRAELVLQSRARLSSQADLFEALGKQGL